MSPQDEWNVTQHVEEGSQRLTSDTCLGTSPDQPPKEGEINGEEDLILSEPESASPIGPIELPEDDLSKNHKRRRSASPDEARKRAELSASPSVRDSPQQHPMHLQKLNCQIGVAGKNVFGHLSYTTDCAPLLSIDLSSASDPSITLEVTDRQENPLYKNKWSMNQFHGDFAIKDFSIYRAIDRRNTSRKQSDINPLDEVYPALKTDLMVISFTSWTRVTGPVRYGGMNDRLLQGQTKSVKGSMTFLGRPKEPFFITIWFLLSEPWPRVKAELFDVLENAYVNRKSASEWEKIRREAQEERYRLQMELEEPPEDRRQRLLNDLPY